MSGTGEGCSRTEEFSFFELKLQNTPRFYPQCRHVVLSQHLVLTSA